MISTSTRVQTGRGPWFLVVLLAIGLMSCWSAAVSTTVVISQVYGGGGNSGAPWRNDFIELYNLGTTAVDLTGWSVQWTSATGTSWSVTSLSGSIQPGQYYLIQEAAGSGTTMPLLPTPDATGTFGMGGTSGKIALSNSTTALTGACPSGAAVIDFVGYGTTPNCYEGAGRTPAPSNTLSVLRKNGGCTETDNNNTDFETGAPIPRNTSYAYWSCTCNTSNHPAAVFDINNSTYNSDLLWRHTTSGDLSAWFMSLAGPVGTAAPGILSSPDWQIVGSADFNADGSADLLIRNISSGDVVIWYLSAFGFSSQLYLGPVATSWNVLGTGDADGDCYADIYWSDNGGMVSLWLLNATGIKAPLCVADPASIDWKVEGVADFNGDQRKDILWRKVSTGEMSIWNVNETGYLSATSPGAVDTAWQIVGLGDVNGDRKADIFWYNATLRNLDAWFQTIYGDWTSVNLGTLPDDNWSVDAIGDFDANGKSDVLLRNINTGEISVWFCTEAGHVGDMAMGIVDLGWRVQNGVVFAGGL